MTKYIAYFKRRNKLVYYHGAALAGRTASATPEKEGLNMSNNTDQTISNLEANSLDAPPGWIRPEVYAAALDKARAYRRQIIAAGIKPDLETYRDD